MSADGGEAYHPEPAPGFAPDERDVFCNRTLNLHAIRAIGYDMDYTLVHYHVEAWERRVYETVQRKLLDQGWPVADLVFDPELVVRGLIIDTELGNIVKANRFGYVKRALHGTRELSWEEVRRDYARTIVDLAEPRWVFLNTLFSISEATIYAQLVDRFEGPGLPASAPTFDRLYRHVRTRVDEAHLEGELKAEIEAHPERFVDLDPELPLTLLDQQRAGKKLLIITNSEWPYTRFVMSYAFDRFLPAGTTWRDLFDVVIVAARKPVFFTDVQPIYEVVDDAGLLRPWQGRLQPGRVYHGGSAAAVEAQLGLSGEEILYVGDHIWGDVHVSKSTLRWRTALVLRELEDEIRAQRAFAPSQRRLAELMREKAALEAERDQARLRQQRLRGGYGPPPPAAAGGDPPGAPVEPQMERLRARIAVLDEQIGPLAQAATELCSPRWGPLLRTGNDKSHLARQIERHADIYLSRASNLLHKTPFVYLRSPRGSLPHDPE
jgi:HAD superfamily 5'-nucleotidase-like hydrolase